MNNEVAELNQIRLDEGLSYAELGKAIGLDRTALYRILQQPGRQPYDRTLHKIRRFLVARGKTKRSKR